jgi:purine-binding chemotaxis protein CheW
MDREFITCEVAGQQFGLDIMAIREIRAWSPATRLPHVPSYMAGVVNLRGTVLPVMDLAARLGWEKTEPTPRHAIIVTHVGGQARGLIVDSVNDIVTIPADLLQQPDAAAQGQVLNFLEGLAPVEDRMVMVLNLEALCTEMELEEAA